MVNLFLILSTSLIVVGIIGTLIHYTGIIQTMWSKYKSYRDSDARTKIPGLWQSTSFPNRIIYASYTPSPGKDPVTGKDIPEKWIFEMRSPKTLKISPLGQLQAMTVSERDELDILFHEAKGDSVYFTDFMDPEIPIKQFKLMSRDSAVVSDNETKTDTYRRITANTVVQTTDLTGEWRSVNDPSNILTIVADQYVPIASKIKSSDPSIDAIILFGGSAKSLLFSTFRGKNVKKQNFQLLTKKSAIVIDPNNGSLIDTYTKI